ncbi:type IX secretion system membrane protein PorP/SprF [bacterium SCSIO 12741]|nr:type IX secretion system membrane protein PorP/SprF [bacterium SCSIO 12741]
MKNLLISTLTVLFGFTASAQQEPQFTQNFANQLFVNPAYAGATGSICATMAYRNQWIGFEGSPKDMLFTLHAPLVLFDSASQLNPAIGFSFVRDRIGFQSMLGYKVALTNRFYIPYKGYLHVGLGVGAYGVHFDFSEALSTDGEYGAGIRDEFINARDQHTDYGLDLDLGVYYRSFKGNFQAGAALKHLNGLTIDGRQFVRDSNTVQSNRFHLAPNLTIHGSYQFRGRGAWSFEPGLLVKTEFRTLQIDASVRAIYRQSIWAGLVYRFQDAVSPMIGYQMRMGRGLLKIGASYDITTSRLIQHSSGSFELFANYCFNLPREEMFTKIHSGYRGVWKIR